MPEARKLNLRLPQDLHAEAAELAEYMGVSLNGLCIMALRNWITYQNRNRSAARVFPLGTKSFMASAGLAQDAKRVAVQVSSALANKVGPNEPCPCGSGKKYKRCHGAPGERL